MELIAEIGQYHDGSMDRLFNLVENLCLTDVDTIKLQHHIAEAESSPQERFRIKFSDSYATRFDYWKAMEIGIHDLEKIKLYCEKKDKNFLCTPFSLRAVDELNQLGVKRFKVGSADVDNHLLLARISEVAQSIIISNGLRNYEALANAIGVCKDVDAITVMHCTTAYPTKLRDVNWQEINALKNSFPDAEIGLSDHSGEIWPAIFALSSELSAFEFHIAYSKLDFGPDTSSSLTFDDLEKILSAKRAWEEVNRPISEKTRSALKETANVFSRSVRLTQDVSAGEAVSLQVLETFKPGKLGLSPLEAFKLLNRKFTRELAAGHILQIGDIT